MDALDRKFLKLGAEYAPGQEVRQACGEGDIRGDKISGTPVDFSHGDAFTPIPGAIESFNEGVKNSGKYVA